MVLRRGARSSCRLEDQRQEHSGTRALLESENFTPAGKADYSAPSQFGTYRARRRWILPFRKQGNYEWQRNRPAFRSSVPKADD